MTQTVTFSYLHMITSSTQSSTSRSLPLILPHSVCLHFHDVICCIKIFKQNFPCVLFRGHISTKHFDIEYFTVPLGIRPRHSRHRKAYESAFHNTLSRWQLFPNNNWKQTVVTLSSPVIFLLQWFKRKDMWIFPAFFSISWYCLFDR